MQRMSHFNLRLVVMGERGEALRAKLESNQCSRSHSGQVNWWSNHRVPIDWGTNLRPQTEMKLTISPGSHHGPINWVPRKSLWVYQVPRKSLWSGYQEVVAMWVYQVRHECPGSHCGPIKWVHRKLLWVHQLNAQEVHCEAKPETTDWQKTGFIENSSYIEICMITQYSYESWCYSFDEFDENRTTKGLWENRNLN
jgi:hypothetical protein